MKKKMLAVTLILFIGLLFSGTIYYFIKNPALYSLSITFGTIFYHFAMRLAVGFLINNKFHNHIDYTLKWFKERDFEQKFYIWIQIKKWKKWSDAECAVDWAGHMATLANAVQAKHFRLHFCRSTVLQRLFAWKDSCLISRNVGLLLASMPISFLVIPRAF